MTTISTALGTIAGVDRHGVLQFRGIRYGAPPTGDRRFLAPESAGAWTGIHDGTRFGNRAPQPVDDSTVHRGKPDEDCLFLNIYTPAADASRRPVLVWFHGGGNTNGSANDYDGTVLSSHGDVVVVCINYRLGVLGFADLGPFDSSLAGSAANGYRDQMLGLAWVRDNIADYGGDPECVTIFGESAGGGGVLAMLAAPAAQGLFHRAVACSPGGLSAPPVDVVPLIARVLGIEIDQVARELQSMSSEEIVEAQTASGYSLGGGYDGVVVQGPVPDAIRRSGAAGVPLLIGSNRDEGTLFNMGAPDDPAALERIRRAIARTVTRGGPTDGYLARLRAAHPDADDKMLNHLVWVDRYRRISVDCAEAATAAGPGGWLYRFDYATTVLDGSLGATHGCDVPFTFNAFAAPNPQLAMYSPDDAVACELAAKWSSTVVRFARTGDPNGDDVPEWRRYAEPERVCMLLDETWRAVPDVDHPHRRLWAS